MSLELDGTDMLAMVQWIERQAGEFYSGLADKAEDGLVRKMLRDLAAMERVHEQVFLALHDAHAADVGVDNSQYAHILTQLCVDVRAALTACISGNESPEDLLFKAVDFEKSTVVFFAGLREVMSDEAGKAQLDGILREEVGHVFLLSGRLPHVSKAGFHGDNFRGLGDPASV